VASVGTDFRPIFFFFFCLLATPDIDMYYPGLVKALRTWYHRHRRKLLAGSKKNLEKWQQEQNM
jgi:hypothetical protein